MRYGLIFLSLVFSWSVQAADAPRTPMAQAQGKVEVFPQIGQVQRVGGIAYGLDGQVLVTGGYAIVIWDVLSGRERQRLAGEGFAISPDGRSLAIKARSQGSIGSYGIRVIDLATGEETAPFRDFGAAGLSELAYTAQGRLLVAAIDEKERTIAHIRDGISGQDVVLLRAYANEDFGYGGLGFTFSHDGRFAAQTVSNGSAIGLWDLTSGRQLGILRPPLPDGALISYPKFSPDGSLLVFVTTTLNDNPGKVGIFDLASRRLRYGPPSHNASFIPTTLAFSAQGKLAFIGGNRKAVVLDPTSGRVQESQEANGAFAIGFSPDGRTLAYSDLQNAIRIWDSQANRELARLGGNVSYVSSAAPIPGTSLFASGDGNGQISIWDTRSGRRAIKIDQAHRDQHIFALVAINDRLLASAGRDGSLRLWHPLTGQSLGTLVDPQRDGPGAVINLALSGNGRSLAAYQVRGEQSELRVWDVATRKETVRITDAVDSYRSIALSPNGAMIAAGRNYTSKKGYGLDLWDVASGRILHSLETTGISFSISFSPDGQFLLADVTGKGVTLWNLKTKQEVATLRGHEREWRGKKTDDVNMTALSPDGKTLASLDTYGNLVLWDWLTRRQTASMRNPLQEATSWPDHLSFSADGRTVLVYGSKGIKLHDVKSGKERATLIRFRNDEWVTVTPEGYFVASEQGGQLLNVRSGNQVSGIDRYYESFFRPDLVQLALAGRSLSGAATLASVKLAPQIAIVDTPAVVSSDQVTVSVRVTDQGGGIGEVRLYRNGTAVVLEKTRNLQVTTAQGLQTLRFKVPLVPDSNTIRAIAFNADNSMQSADATLEIQASIAPKPPALHALVIGVKDFANPRLALKYTVADAELFAATLEEKARGLFSSITVRRLVKPAETTNTAIVEALKRMQQEVQPNDLFVFFVATHGTVDDGDYFLITSNVGSVSTARLRQDALTQDTLKELIANIPAAKKLVILDTCAAGKLGDALQVALLTRGLSDETAMKVLARAVGSTVLAASTSVQEALEGYKGHGLFSYVIVEGLKGAADADKDGYVKTLELADYVDNRVPELAEKVFKHKQYPMVSPVGQGFPLVKLR